MFVSIICRTINYRMPRQDSEVWKYFTKIKTHESKLLKGKCKFCNSLYTTNAKRMRNHLLLYCSSVPEHVKKHLKDKTENTKITKQMVKCILITGSQLNLKLILENLFFPENYKLL